MIAEKINIVNLNVLRFDFEGLIDNKKLKEVVLKTRELKKSRNPKNGLYEDNEIDNDHPAMLTLRKHVDTVFKQLDNRFKGSSNSWGHILYTGQQTTPHSHLNLISISEHPDNHIQTASIATHALSWCYYVEADEKSGEIVFVPEYKGFEFGITPKTSSLLVFPNWMTHYTKLNHSDNIRISISGNRFLSMEQMRSPTRDVLDIYGYPDRTTRSI